MGDTQKLSPDEQIRSAFEAYEGGKDFTVAVEEEFAILDPETLELANRFEELQEAAKGGPLEAHLVGELIASEVEVRTGRCETFADAAALVPTRTRISSASRPETQQTSPPSSPGCSRSTRRSACNSPKLRAAP